jgi:hypothetical protein
VLFDRVGLLGQRHLAGDLGVCGLRSHATPPSIVLRPNGLLIEEATPDSTPATPKGGRLPMQK